MATYNGVNAAKIADPSASNIIDPGGAIHGNVHCWTDTYVGLGTEANLETIAMGPEMPVGAKILWYSITCNAIGGTPDLGDGVDVDAYIDEATDNAVTMANDVITGIGKEITATTQQATVTLDALVTAAGVITVSMMYTAD